MCGEVVYDVEDWCGVDEVWWRWGRVWRGVGVCRRDVSGLHLAHRNCTRQASGRRGEWGPAGFGGLQGGYLVQCLKINPYRVKETR